MIAGLGFGWLLYQVVKLGINKEVELISVHENMEPVSELLDDTGNWLSYMKSVGDGIHTILAEIHPLFAYWIEATVVMIVVAYVLKLVMGVVTSMGGRR